MVRELKQTIVQRHSAMRIRGCVLLPQVAMKGQLASPTLIDS